MGAGQKPTKLSKSALSKMEEAKTRAIGTRTLLPAPPVPTGTEAPSSHTQRAESQRCVPGPTNSVIRRPQTPHRSGSSPSLASCTLQVFPDAQSTWPPRAALELSLQKSSSWVLEVSMMCVCISSRGRGSTQVV